MTPTLLKRVESARGPDRELDRDVFLALFPNAQLGEHVRGEGELIWNIEGYYKQPVPDLSSSLDAAVSLCERVLPGCSLTLNHQPWWGEASKWKHEARIGIVGHEKIPLISMRFGRNHTSSHQSGVNVGELDGKVWGASAGHHSLALALVLATLRAVRERARPLPCPTDFF